MVSSSIKNFKQMKIKEAIKQFLTHCRFSKNLSDHTLKAYSIDFRKFQSFAGPKMGISDCDVLCLRNYMRYLFEDCRLKETSIKRRMASLKVMFRWLEINEMININPFLDAHAAAKISVAKFRLELGNISNIKWFEGIGEYKINWGPGYRIYLAQDGKSLIVLLGGGTKRKQQADIKRAKELFKEYKTRKIRGDLWL